MPEPILTTPMPAPPRPMPERVRCTNCGLIQLRRAGPCACRECGHTGFSAA